MRAIKVTYENGDVISTSMAAGLSDSEMLDYFKVGRVFNIGNVTDNMQAIVEAEILV